MEDYPALRMDGNAADCEEVRIPVEKLWMV
jgi:hypothetical protein